GGDDAGHALLIQAQAVEHGARGTGGLRAVHVDGVRLEDVLAARLDRIGHGVQQRESAFAVEGRDGLCGRAGALGECADVSGHCWFSRRASRSSGAVPMATLRSTMSSRRMTDSPLWKPSTVSISLLCRPAMR